MDSFVFVVIWQTCAQFGILQVQIRKLGCSKNVSQNKIKELIDNHAYQIRFNIHLQYNIYLQSKPRLELN